MNTQSNPPSVPTTLSAIGEVQETDKRAYFLASFKRGTFGKSCHRTFWGDKQDDGSVKWERVSPDDLKALLGRDLSAEVEVIPVDIEPEEFAVPSTGEIRLITSRTIVRFLDETVELACRRYGSRIREQHAEAEVVTEPVAQVQQGPHPTMPGVFHVVGKNGIPA